MLAVCCSTRPTPAVADVLQQTQVVRLLQLPTQKTQGYPFDVGEICLAAKEFVICSFVKQTIICFVQGRQKMRSSEQGGKMLNNP